MTSDFLRAAHDAGYLHGLIVGGLLFGFIGLSAGVCVTFAWIVREDESAHDEPTRASAWHIVAPRDSELWR